MTDLYRGTRDKIGQGDQALGAGLSIALAVFLLLTPIPHASHNSAAWLVAAIYLTTLAGSYVLWRGVAGPRDVLAVQMHPVLGLLGLLVLLAAAMQLLPMPFARGVPEPTPAYGTYARSATQLAVLRLTSYAALFVLVLEVGRDQARARWLLNWIYGAIVAHAIWALISLGPLQDTLLLSPKAAYVGYATGTFVNRNAFASFLGMGVIIAIVRCVAARGQPLNVLWHLVWMAVLTVTLFATGSRMGAFVGGSGAVLAAMVMLAKARRGFVGLAALPLCGAAVAFSQSTTFERVVFADFGADARSELFRQTWAMIRENPWWGYGLDSFPAVFPMGRQAELPVELTWHTPHNTYLTLWFEYGIPLGSLTILLVGYAAVQLLCIIRTAVKAPERAVVALTTIAVTSVHALVDFSLEIAANVYFFIAIVGLGLAAPRQKGVGG